MTHLVRSGRHHDPARARGGGSEQGRSGIPPLNEVTRRRGKVGHAVGLACAWVPSERDCQPHTLLGLPVRGCPVSAIVSRTRCWACLCVDVKSGASQRERRVSVAHVPLAWISS